MKTETSRDRELLYSEVTDAILADLRSGRRPDVARLAARYPALAGELESHVAQLERILRAAPPAKDDQLPRRLGDFWLVRELGRGGMGVVYEAEQLSQPRRVAVKPLPPDTLLQPLRLQRFQHEIQAAARLHHPHIVPVLAVSGPDELPHYAMQLIDGPSVASLVWERKAAGGAAGDAGRFAAAATWCRQAAEALHYAHEVGVIHRDVKPGNLLLGADGNLWVTDFGLARLRGEAELTATGDVVGTLRYVSPEQAQGARGVIDHRVDIYGLGVTLYELLTLEPAVPGEERGELLRRLLHEEPRRPRSIDPAIPHELETVVLKAMRKDPAERYATAAELADDLGRFLAGQPVRARRPTRRERARAWLRRHAVGAAVALGVLLVVSAALAVSTAVTVRANAEVRRKQEEAEREKEHADRQRVLAENERERARRQKEYAERSRAVARRAVDQVLTGVMKDWLYGKDRLEPVQKRLLEQLLACCEELSNEDPADAEARFRVAEALNYAGFIRHRLGRHEDGSASNERALAVLDELERRDGTSPARQFLRAMCLNGVGVRLQLVGKWDEAERALRDAIALVDSLAKAYPGETKYRKQGAVLLQNLAYVLQHDRRKWDEADTLYRRAATICSDLCQESPGEPRALFRLAAVRCDQARLLYLMDRLPQAGAAAQDAVGTCRKLVKDFPADPDGRDRLAMSLVALADVRMRGGRHREAVTAAEEAANISARLASESGNYPPYRMRHADNLGTLADALMRVGKIREAERASIKAVETYRGLKEIYRDARDLRASLAGSLFRVGWCGLRTGRRAEAEVAYREGIDLMFPIVRAEPAKDGFRRDLMAAVSALRLTQATNVQPSQVAESQRHVLDDLRATAKQQPGERTWRVAMADTLGFLGAVHLKAGREGESEKYYRQQLELLKELATPSAPVQPTATLTLAWFFADCPMKGLRDAEQAHELARQGWQASPRKTLRGCVILAAAKNAVGRYEEAARLLEPQIKSVPDTLIDFWRHWAIAQYHLGRKDLAREALHKIATVLKATGQPAVEHQLLLPEVNELLGSPEPSLRFPRATSPGAPAKK